MTNSYKKIAGETTNGHPFLQIILRVIDGEIQWPDSTKMNIDLG
jgi:hypothetical protein